MAQLTVRQKLGFGIFDLGGNMLFTVTGFWCLNYLTDTVGLAAALAGIAVMVGKVWDAVTDPVMGYISDRTKTRFGRRRPYLLIGAPLMVLTMWFFFTKPAIDSVSLLTVWATVALMFLNTASTIINIPYSSLTPELSDDYHERTSLNGYRFGCAVFGTIIGAAAVQPIVGLFPNQTVGFSMVGLILGLIIAGTTLLTFFGTKEKTNHTIPTEPFFATYKVVFTNRPYVVLLMTYALHLTGITLLQGILVYYTKYIYHNEALTTPAMLLLLLTAMVFIPVSVLISKKIGKKRTYQICFVIIATACAAIFTVGHILGPLFFLVMMVYAGIGVGFSYVAPFAMVPDAIDYEASRTGDHKEGAYYGIWTFVAKVGQSLAVFLSGMILDIGGYSADAVQSTSALFAIRIIIGPVPVVIFIGALLLIERYALDEKTVNMLARQRDSA
ncbi:MAG: MFS transporter [Treponema sp.]|jgi:GPH family glycoside/pentoside/hexuronide:cation symporter|nr:MFS transporter [Treponema sp.]